ncbi:MAG: hypothetical protein OXR66_03845 [Candidatus Woesearchaeota archaeon]|nr:hypothetical protein [Candidatus Woesearchaeota archaeon]
MGKTLAVCALLNNAEASALKIDRTLKLLRPILDEAVIGISTQTTDSTQEIVEATVADWSIPVTVFPYEWQNNFSHAINTLLEKANADWSMRLHQDMRPDLRDLDALRSFVDTEDGTYDIIRAREVYLEGRDFRCNREFLFRRGTGYDGIIWESPVYVPGKEHGTIAENDVTPDRELFSPFTIVHDGKHGAAQYYRDLTVRERMRVRELRRTAESASDFYHVGRRYQLLQVTHQQSTSMNAHSAFSASAELEPSEPAPHIQLGDLAKRQGREEKAAEHFMHARELGSTVASNRIERLYKAREPRKCVFEV